MKMKKLAVSMLSVGLIMSLGTGTLMASAEDDTSAKSKVEVQFTVPDVAEVNLYDPRDPSKELDRDKYKDLGKITGQTGPLSLNYVTHLDFGGDEIDVTEKKYEFIANEDHFLQVTDRRGNGAGWNVTARLDKFENSEAEGTETLPGSEIKFTNGNVGATNESLSDQKPEVKNFSLTAGGPAASVASAEADKGRGAWLIRWLKGEENNTEVKLTVAANAASRGNHITTINWTLENGPYQAGTENTGE